MRYAVIAPQKECCVHESCIFAAFCPRCPLIRLLLTLFLRHAETLLLSCPDLFPYSVELRKRMWKLVIGLLYYALIRQYDAIAHSNSPSGKTSRCVFFLIFCVYYSLLGCDAIISEEPSSSSLLPLGQAKGSSWTSLLNMLQFNASHPRRR